MKAAARQRAHRKRRRDSGIVGQATTNEPIDTRVPACYACSTLVLVGSGGGTASVWLATFKPMSCLFSLVVAGALQRPRAVTLRPRPPTAVEAVNLTIHRSHSTAAATNKNTQGTENDSPSPARSNVLRLSLAAGNAPFYTAINKGQTLRRGRASVLRTIGKTNKLSGCGELVDCKFVRKLARSIPALYAASVV